MTSHSTSRLRHAAALAWVALLAATAPAHAATYDLGTITDPGLRTFIDIVRTEPFEDVFTFRIAPDTGFVVHGGFDTNFSNRSWIHDLDGRLDRGSVTILEGADRTVWSPEFPRREVYFDTTLVTAGTYSLHVSGTPSSAWPGIPSAYQAAFVFNIAPNVPEPGAMAMMVLGLAGVGAAARKRRG